MQITSDNGIDETVERRKRRRNEKLIEEKYK